MPEVPFILTIDTEGDDLWSQPRRITTRNAQFLPRFQQLCERYRLKPVYLVNYEMAMSEAFVEFARDVLARDTGEVGMHLHAWNSPPLAPLTADDFRYQPYLIEYPDDVMRDKIALMTELLEDRFGRKMVSHRAGRWGFDERYAAMLAEQGYLVDCSVTPGVDWGACPGDPAGSGGSDYTGFPRDPYVLDCDDISRAGAAGRLLEVPVTVRESRLNAIAPWSYEVPLVRSAAWRLTPRHRWLCPAQTDAASMLAVAREALAGGARHLEFMLHSSELMPGGSPSFRTPESVERLYGHMEALFDGLAGECRGVTLQELHAAGAAAGHPA